MITVIVVVHLLIAFAMIGLILLQKTEGNASGGGFSTSANLNTMMQPRARPNALGRATTVLGFLFFASSLGLALISKQTGPAVSILSGAGVEGAPKVSEIRSGEPTPPVSGTTAPALSGTPAPTLSGTPPSVTPAPSVDGAATPPAAPPAVPVVPNN